MMDAWPVENQAFVSREDEEKMEQLMQVIRGIRNIRAEFQIPPGTRIPVVIATRDEGFAHLLGGNQAYIQEMGRVKRLTVETSLDQKPAQAVSAVTALAEIYVLLEGVLDVDKEVARLEKDLKNAQAELDKALGKLGNQQFLARAPREVISKEEAKAEEARQKKEGIQQRLQILKS